MTTIARTERAALADLLDDLGPEAPTLCTGWDTRDLAAHLVIRERRPDASLGVAVKALARHTRSVQASYARRPYGELVHLVRTGPGRMTPFALPGVDKLLNTAEYVVHHEDVRRAQPGWTPRDLPPKVQDALWKAVAGRAALTFHGLRYGVQLHRSDRPDAEPITPAKGDPVATVTGTPLELLLYCYGRRDHAQVETGGDPAAVAELTSADLTV